METIPFEKQTFLRNAQRLEEMPGVENVAGNPPPFPGVLPRGLPESPSRTARAAVLEGEERRTP